MNWEDHVTDESLRDVAKIEWIAVNMRRRRLHLYVHVLRRDREEDMRMVAEMRVQGRRQRGRPKIRWVDTVKEDIRNGASLVT